MEYVELKIFLQKKQFLMKGYFVKHFIFLKAHPLPEEHEVSQYRTKSPGLNHQGILGSFPPDFILKNSYWTSRPP
jgi:hypothetical protein